MLKKSISIVIPAFNEDLIIESVLGSIKTNLNLYIDEIIVVDDGSSDNTATKANIEGIKLIKHTRNLGYGAALKTGIKNSSSEYVLTMDGDGQHKHEEIKKLIDSLKNQDAIIGSRKGMFHSNLWRMPGKWFLQFLAEYLIGKKIDDLNSGLRLVKKDIFLKYMHLCPQGFSFSTTITMVLLSRGYELQYVPIDISKRTGKSMVNVKTGFDTIILVLRLATLFNPLKIFLPISSVFMLLGGFKTFMDYFSNGPITTGSLLALITGILIFSLGLISDQISQIRTESFDKKY